MKKKFVILISFFLGSFSTLQADTIDFWHFYYNDTIVLKGNQSYFNRSENPPLEVEIKIRNLASDFIRLMYFTDSYYPTESSYFLLTNDKERLLLPICAINRMLDAKHKRDQVLGIMKSPKTRAIYLYEILEWYPEPGIFTTIKVYYTNEYKDCLFPNEKQKLLGILKFI